MKKFYKDLPIIQHYGYEEVYFPEHPYASSIGLVYVHRLVAEEFLGRYLNPQECVHHVDEVRNHNDINNLWIFKSCADHIRYHQAKKNKLDFILQRTNGVYTCKIISTKAEYICPVCKGRKSQRAKVCHNCQVREMHKGAQLDKETLFQLLKTTSYSEIGRQYNMSNNGVKKIAKRYGLYQKCFVDCPDIPKLMELLKTQSYKDIAIHFNVSANTVHTWVRHNHIHIVDLRYLCVETGEKYSCMQDAAKQKYSDIAPKVAARYIKQSYTSGKVYHGYHWQLLDREVTIK